MIVVVVESPSKCKTIESYLPDGHRCVACCGHFRSLLTLDDVRIDGEGKGVRLKFHPMKDKAQAVARLKKAVAIASEVVLATDLDREGEAIAWHVLDHFKLPADTKRVVFSEITRAAITAAFASPRTVDMDLVRAQHARQVLDLTIGHRVSPVLWAMPGVVGGVGLSAGRCQVPALRLVHHNARARAAAAPTYDYHTHAYFGRMNQLFRLRETLDEADVRRLLADSPSHSHAYRTVSVAPTAHAAPRPFNTSRLQQAASNELRLSPKETMVCAQTLYEMGLITYMRTDAEAVSAEFGGAMRRHVVERWGEAYARERPPVGAESAHEAIRPTSAASMESRVAENKLRAVYALIHANAVQSFMSDARGQRLVGELTCPRAEGYRCDIEKIHFDGWTAAKRATQAQAERDDAFEYMRALPDGTVLDYNAIHADVQARRGGSLFTEARLVGLLDERGIGRPSTYAGLVEKLQQHYLRVGDAPGVERECVGFTLRGERLDERRETKRLGGEGRKLLLRPAGVLAARYLDNETYAGADGIFSYEFTQEMERALDRVASGAADWRDVCADLAARVESALDGRAEHDAAFGRADGRELRVDVDERRVTFCVGKTPYVRIGEGDDAVTARVRDDADVDAMLDGRARLGEIVDEDATIDRVGPARVRRLDDDTSVRTGRYGDYVMRGRKKPTFTSLKTFGGDAWTCDAQDVLGWLETAEAKPKVKARARFNFKRR